MKLAEYYRCTRCKAITGLSFRSRSSSIMCPGCHSSDYTKKIPVEAYDMQKRFEKGMATVNSVTEEEIKEMKEALKAIQDMYEGENK